MSHKELLMKSIQDSIDAGNYSSHHSHSVSSHNTIPMEEKIKSEAKAPPIKEEEAPKVEVKSEKPKMNIRSLVDSIRPDRGQELASKLEESLNKKFKRK